MGPFLDAMKARTRSLHSTQQLAGVVIHRARVKPRHEAIAGFTKYLAEQREIYVALKDFPVAPTANFVEALDTDLWFLELETWHADMPWVLPNPYRSAYADYIRSLPVHRQGCHYYNLAFAHLVGGNRRVAETAMTDVLPPNWIAQSEFYALPRRVEDLDGLRERFEDEARTWTPTQREECLNETPEAFARATRLNKLLLG